MELLGKLGIDPGLLLAQIVNFGLLLLILNKFLYQPLIKKIEKDEREMQKVKEEKKILEKEREEFEKTKRKEIAEARKDVQEMIKDAREMAKKIQEKARQEIAREKLRIIRQAKESAQDYTREITENFQKEWQERALTSIKHYLERLDKKIIKDWQEVFFQELIKGIGASNLPKLSSYDIKNIGAKSNNKIKSKKISEFLQHKIGYFYLEYTPFLTTKQEKSIQELLAKKIGTKEAFKLEKKENKDLIIGFKLEVGGLLIESNLLSQIKEVVNKN